MKYHLSSVDDFWKGMERMDLVMKFLTTSGYPEDTPIARKAAYEELRLSLIERGELCECPEHLHIM